MTTVLVLLLLYFLRFAVRRLEVDCEAPARAPREAREPEGASLAPRRPEEVEGWSGLARRADRRAPVGRRSAEGRGPAGGELSKKSSKMSSTSDKLMASSE